MGYRENIVDLKGKNGLDLDLDLIFTPNSNMYFGSVGGVRTDWFNNAGVNATAIDTPLGIGWSFNLPFVSYTYEYDLSISARNRHVYRYHMKDGGAYKIVDDPDSTNMILEDYPRDDIHVERISGYADSIPLRYKVVFADGRYETFDENGQIRETGDRFGNCLTETFAGKTDTYEYDMNGNRTKHTDPAGARIMYEPDAMQKVYAINPSSESGARTFEYTLTGKLLIGLDATGVGVVRRWHDDRGNATMEQNTGFTKYYTYDIEGKRESLEYDDVSLTYTYNTLGQLTAVNNANVPVVTYTYDNNGNIATEAKSAVTQSYTYNRDGSIASIVTTNNIDNTSETTSYTYYLNGNLKTETLPDNTTKTYTYNNRDMLVTEALSTGKTTTYAYNNSGNRTSKTVTQNNQNTVTSYTYDNANRLTQEQTGSASISYTYDDNGRLISRTSGSVTDTFAYNGYNEMKKAVVNGTTTDYTYYVDGLRRSKKTGSNTSYEFWDGDNIIADTVSGYTIANNYIRGLRLAEIDDGTATRQYTFNAHGDVTGLVDTTTGAVTDYAYDAYGNEDNASATDTNPFRYSGEYYDAETGFIYLRARYYDPSIGRFTAEDPIRDGTNWYVYCNNNPVMFIDPTGYIAVDDGVYNSWTQDKLLGYTLDYYNAYFVGDAEAMSVAANSAQALREQSSPQAWYSRLFDTQAARTENNLILSHQKALSLGYTEGSVEYGLALTAYTLAMNDIDARGQVLYDNLLQLYGASAMGTLSIAKSAQVGKWDKATFQSEAKYSDHYKRHGKDFGNVSKAGYLQGARDLLNAKTGKNIQGFVAKDGSLFKYNTKTNEFAIGSSYGTISTYYKPTDGYIYWLDQMANFGK